MNTASKNARIFAAAGAVIGWFALALQFYLIIVNRAAPVSETIIRYFSYFTILTNTLVALRFTSLSFREFSRLKIFFSSPPVSAAVTIYITVVGLVYQFLLRHTWEPEGWQLIADELLHSVIPLYAIVYWIVFSDKNNLSWKNVPGWLLYPLVYLFFILLRGAGSGFYPYPFVDVGEFGYGKVAVNSAGMMFAFIVLSVLFISASKIISRK